MKLVSFVPVGGGSRLPPRWGVLGDEGIVDCATAVSPHFRGIQDVLAAEALGEVASLVASAQAQVRLADVELLPPVKFPGQKVVCVGVNYADHRAEGRLAEASYPTIFTRFPDTLVGDGVEIVRNPAGNQLDYEGELAVVIGRRAESVELETAMEYVAGYTCFNDISVRDWQFHTSQWTPGKNFTGTGVMGPYLVTADEVPDVNALDLKVTVNGILRQEARTSGMLFNIPQLITYITTFTPLQPGDVIVTGTPAGVGAFADPPSFLEHGDIVEVSITQLGRLRNRVVIPSGAITSDKSSGTATVGTD